MLSRVSLQLPKTTARSISSSTPVRVLQQTLTASSSGKSNVPEVTLGEKVWCDIYGVDYEKQIQEALHESPAAAEAAPKNVNYPTASVESKTQEKDDIWNVVFGDKNAV